MSFTLNDLATLVDGELCGDPDLVITGANIIRDAGESDITLADAAHQDKLAGCPAAAALTSSDGECDRPHIKVDDVHAEFTKIVALFRPSRTAIQPGVDASAIVAESATIGEGVTIQAGVVIGENVVIEDRVVLHYGVQIMEGCRVGEATQLFPRVVLYEHTIIGKRAILHAGVVIGAYGFGYESATGSHVLSAQLGFVELDDDVEIGANTTIDRGTYGVTSIGQGTKIDNLVQIGHNCRIGRHNLICSQVGIAGSVTTGDYVVMAGQVGIRDHVTVGDHGVLGAKAGAGRDVPAGATYFGVPAIPEREHLQWYMAGRRVPRLIKQVNALEKRVDQLGDKNVSNDAA